MGKVITVVVGAAIFAGAFVAFQMLSAAARPQTKQEIQAQIEKDVAEVKKTLPREVDPVVTWFDVDAQWQTIVYKYKIHAPRDVVVARKKDLEASVKGSMLLGAAKFMMPKDVKMRYELYDDGGGFIYTLDVD